MSPAPRHSTIPEELLSDQPRRGFFASAMAIVIGGVVSLAPVVAGVLFFLDPLIRKKVKGEESSGDEGFVKVNVTLDQLKTFLGTDAKPGAFAGDPAAAILQVVASVESVK